MKDWTCTDPEHSSVFCPPLQPTHLQPPPCCAHGTQQQCLVPQNLLFLVSIALEQRRVFLG